jgi:hypothetical protein
VDITGITFWLVIRKSDNAVVGTSTVEQPAGAWDLGLFDIKPWFDSDEPQLHNPDEGIISLDPTLSNPAYDLLLVDYNEANLAQGGAKAWFTANPNGELLFTLSILDLETEIDALDLSSLPVGTANKLKLLLKTLAVSTRVFAKKQGLI